MRRVMPRLLLLPLLFAAGAVLLSACTEEEEQQAQEAATEVRQEAREAWASLRTDGERLVDRVQTRNDPEAKQQLLDRCRNALEQMRENNVAQTDRVERLCEQIQDADVDAGAAWDEIRSRLRDLNRELGES